MRWQPYPDLCSSLFFDVRTAREIRRRPWEPARFKRWCKVFEPALAAEMRYFALSDAARLASERRRIYYESAMTQARYYFLLVAMWAQS